MDFGILILETLLLSKKQIESLITVDDAIEIVEKVYRGHTEGTIVMPPKLSLDLGESGRWPNFDSYINSMPAYVGEYKVAGVKIIGGFFANVGSKLPSIIGLILLFDPSTGVPLAIMDATHITALRTGASVAVGAKYLAKKGVSTLSLIGAGTQSRFSLRALARLYDFDRVEVKDNRKEAAQRFVKEMSDELSINIVNSVDEKKIFSSDIIVSATTSKNPVIYGAKLAKGSLVEPLGSYQEIDFETVTRASKVFVDNLDQAKHRGSFASLISQGVIGPQKISGEISEVIAGKMKGRESDSDIVIFEPIGLGSTDIACASFTYLRAKEQALGESFEFL